MSNLNIVDCNVTLETSTNDPLHDKQLQTQDTINRNSLLSLERYPDSLPRVFSMRYHPAVSMQSLLSMHLLLVGGSDRWVASNTLMYWDRYSYCILISFALY